MIPNTRVLGRVWQSKEGVAGFQYWGGHGLPCLPCSYAYASKICMTGTHKQLGYAVAAEAEVRACITDIILKNESGFSSTGEINNLLITAYIGIHQKIIYVHVLNVSLVGSQQISCYTVALRLTGDSEAEESAHFAEMMDRFFDYLNVHNYTQGYHKCKASQNMYCSLNDPRLKVHIMCLVILTINAYIFFYSGLKMIFSDIWISGRDLSRYAKGLTRKRRPECCLAPLQCLGLG